MKLVMEFDSAAQAREELTVLLGISSAPVPVAEPEVQAEVEEPKKRGRPKKVTTQDEPDPPKVETVDPPKVETVDPPKVETVDPPKVEVTEQSLRELCMMKAEKVGINVVKEAISKIANCTIVAEVPKDKMADVYEAVKNLSEETL